MVLPLQFYRQDTLTVAQQLLGKFLVHNGAGGMIVETEAYLGPQDLASHSYKGKTPRNAVMFGPAGWAYVYFTYGMHYCFNVITAGAGEAVLIRALEPTDGLAQMRSRRSTENLLSLCGGPAKLVQALAITPDLNGSDLISGPIQILDRNAKVKDITATPRIGINRDTDKPWRFYITGSPYVSRP